MPDKSCERTLWSTTSALTWFDDVEIDEELRVAIMRALDKVQREELAKRVTPYKSPLRDTSLHKIVRA